MTTEMKEGVIFESIKVSDTITVGIEATTTSTMSSSKSETITVSCDSIESPSSSLWQWHTYSEDVGSVATKDFLCRYGDLINTAPACPLGACDPTYP